VVYQVDVPAGMSQLIARIAEATFDPVLGIRRIASCATSGELGCNDDDFGLLSNVVLKNPAAGTYSIIVDAYRGSGTFTLEIELQP
jgi:hypothetical protein